MTERRAQDTWRTEKAIAALHRRPELRDVFPIGDVIDQAIRENV